jgi:RNA polymerase sigma factor (sigma-70 family)
MLSAFASAGSAGWRAHEESAKVTLAGSSSDRSGRQIVGTPPGARAFKGRHAKGGRGRGLGGLAVPGVLRKPVWAAAPAWVPADRRLDGGEELAQDALVRVWWRWALVRRQEHPEAYARKVLINRHRSLLRRLRLDARRAGQARTEAADAGQREELLVVWAAVGRLPTRQRAVVVLRYHEDLPELEVARLLQMPVGTVKSTANRALARLRKDLAGRLVDRADTGREPR